MSRVRVLFEREAKARLDLQGLGFASLTDLLVKQEGVWVENPGPGLARVHLSGEEGREGVDSREPTAVTIVPAASVGGATVSCSSTYLGQINSSSTGSSSSNKKSMGSNIDSGSSSNSNLGSSGSRTGSSYQQQWRSCHRH